MYLGITLFFGLVLTLTLFDIRAAIARSRKSPRAVTPVLNLMVTAGLYPLS